MPSKVEAGCRASRFFHLHPIGNPPYYTCLTKYVPVAQLDRASDYGSEGREFKSSRARQKALHSSESEGFLLLRGFDVAQSSGFTGRALPFRDKLHAFWVWTLLGRRRRGHAGVLDTAVVNTHEHL